MLNLYEIVYSYKTENVSQYFWLCVVIEGERHPERAAMETTAYRSALPGAHSGQSDDPERCEGSEV